MLEEELTNIGRFVGTWWTPAHTGQLKFKKYQLFDTIFKIVDLSLISFLICKGHLSMKQEFVLNRGRRPQTCQRHKIWNRTGEYFLLEPTTEVLFWLFCCFCPTFHCFWPSRRQSYAASSRTRRFGSSRNGLRTKTRGLRMNQPGGKVKHLGRSQNSLR